MKNFHCDETAPRPVLPHDVRYYEEEPPDDAVVPDNDIPGRRRSCIIDIRDHVSRYEYPMDLKDGKRFNPALHTNADEGPIGKPAASYMYSARNLNIRGSRCRDRAHKASNCVKGAAVDAGFG